MKYDTTTRDGTTAYCSEFTTDNGNKYKIWLSRGCGEVLVMCYDLANDRDTIVGKFTDSANGEYNFNSV